LPGRSAFLTVAHVPGVLSARELEILLLAALSNREIGEKLHLAEATVRRHLANTYSKMDVSSRSEVTRRAIQEEWITVSDPTENIE